MSQESKQSFLNLPISKRSGCLFILLALGLKFCVFPGSSPAEKLYQKGLTAYNEGNCQVATDQLKRAIAESKSRERTLVKDATAKMTECTTFQKTLDQQAAGKTPEALYAYGLFIRKYSTGPLTNVARQQATTVFNQADLTTLAKPVVCHNIKLLQGGDLIPQPQETLPRLYHACGQAYAKTKDYSRAGEMYQQLLDLYPSHSLAPTAKQGLAKAIVADAQKTGTGTIPAPGRSGSTDGGSTVVVIQNASPNTMRIVFSGPTPRIEELAPCKNCVNYVGTGPATCPANVPVGSYTLKPGSYQVLVRSIGSAARPFSGNWALDSGSKYDSCFFIVRRS